MSVEEVEHECVEINAENIGGFENDCFTVQRVLESHGPVEDVEHLLLVVVGMESAGELFPGSNS